jgi:hypothetical protein
MDGRRGMTLLSSRQPVVRFRPVIGLWAVLVLVPVVIGLVWGVYLDDGVYVVLGRARSTATARSLGDSLDTWRQRPSLGLPFYALILSLLARSRIPLPQTALILSALGWGATALAVYSTGQTARRPLAATVAAVLVAFAPVTVSTLGTEVAWSVALAWMAIALSVTGQWHIQTALLAVWMCLFPNQSTLAMTTSLLIVQWIAKRHLSLWAALALVIALLGWGWSTVWPTTGLLSPSTLLPTLLSRIAGWGHRLEQLVDESELYWLFLPCIGSGLLALYNALPKKVLGVGLIAATVLVLEGSTTAWAHAATLVIFLTGLGIGKGLEWIEANKSARLSQLALTLGVILVAGTPLGVAQASSLVQRYRQRPVVLQELEQQAGDWLRAHSDPGVTVLASGRIGYLANRKTIAWSGVDGEPEEIASLLDAVNKDPPGYCVSSKSLAWDRLMQTGWFQSEYVPVQEFASPYGAASPVIIWKRRYQAFDLGEHQPLNVRFPGYVYCLGYRYWPHRIQPGDAVHVTLLMQAMQPLSASFQPVVRMHAPYYGDGWAQISPIEGFGWIQRASLVSSRTLIDSPETGVVFAAQFEVTRTNEVSLGAYYLDVSAVSPGSQRPLAIYQDRDTFPLDRVILGHVIVPWQDTEQRMALRNAKPVGANFGNEIELLGYDVADRLPSEIPASVTLYWEARQPPQEDYVVFVHLLDTDGQRAASHDAPPMDGRYPTKTWPPGEVVPDVHHLVANHPIAQGTYQLSMGMYRWPSMERLPIWDAQGVEQGSRILHLESIEVR